jgi:hypothetical protein
VLERISFHHHHKKYPDHIHARMVCPLFRRLVDLYIQPAVASGYAVACVEHWQYNANVWVDTFAKAACLYAEDACDYAGEGLDAMIDKVDYPRITSDLFIDLRELLLRWNIQEVAARHLIARLQARVDENRRYRNLESIKKLFIEEIKQSFPKMEQPYHLVRPTMVHPRDIFTYISPLQMHISQREDLQVYIAYDCAWEGEYGLALLAREGSLLYIGPDNVSMHEPAHYYATVEANYLVGNILMKHPMPNLRE